MNINEFLATEVMGWHKEGQTKDYQWVDSEGSDEEWAAFWNPSENISQAMMCLERFEGWELTKDSVDGYLCVVWTTKHHGVWCDNAGGPSLPMAISLACARAKGWKD